jgi:hypothetical protein
MSEYAHSELRYPPHDAVLFDDDTFEESNFDYISTAQEGASIELGARALSLHSIMATYNYLNKTRDARKASQDSNSEFSKRYAHPDEVIERMGQKVAGMIHDNENDFKYLNATDELIAVGFDKEDVMRQQRRLKSELLDIYGPGKVHAPERKKFVKKVQVVAHKVNSSMHS